MEIQESSRRIIWLHADGEIEKRGVAQTDSYQEANGRELAS